VGDGRLFARPLGTHCGVCRLLALCGSERTDHACSPSLNLDGPAGPFALHPLRIDFDDHFDRVGGAEFSDIPGKPVPRLELPAYLPQIRWDERLCRERLTSTDVPAVGIRLKEVFRSGRIRTASEVRMKTGLAADVKLVLLLHGKDELLERFDEADLAHQIAAGGYVLVTAPSFSLWEPQRRPDNLLSLRRSMLSYEQLQAAGATTCARVGWVEDRDRERLAAWVDRSGVNLVSLDLMTYNGPSFDRAVAGLARFDESTACRLTYLVDGVRARSKIEALYLATAPDRMTISGATMAMPAPAETSGISMNSFLARTKFIAARCAAATVRVAAAHTTSIEVFISSTLDSTESKSALWATSQGSSHRAAAQH
jgi:hypothetical protein